MGSPSSRGGWPWAPPTPSATGAPCLGPGLQSARAHGRHKPLAAPDQGACSPLPGHSANSGLSPVQPAQGLPGRRTGLGQVGPWPCLSDPWVPESVTGLRAALGGQRGRHGCRILPVAPSWSGTWPEQHRYLRSRQSPCGPGHVGFFGSAWTAPSNSQLHKTQEPRRFIGDPSFLCVGFGKSAQLHAHSQGLPLLRCNLCPLPLRRPSQPVAATADERRTGGQKSVPTCSRSPLH